MCTTIQYLEDKILKTPSFTASEVTPEAVAAWLCGFPGDRLAQDPFSIEFLENVSYNNTGSMPGILYLQLLHASK